MNILERCHILRIGHCQQNDTYICGFSPSPHLQTNLAESQQSFSAKEGQLQHLSLELQSAQANASDLAKVHEDTEQQLQQQKTLLKQVVAQSTTQSSILLPSVADLHCSLCAVFSSICMQVAHLLQLLGLHTVMLLLPCLCKPHVDFCSHLQTLEDFGGFDIVHDGQAIVSLEAKPAGRNIQKIYAQVSWFAACMQLSSSLPYDNPLVIQAQAWNCAWTVRLVL